MSTDRLLSRIRRVLDCAELNWLETIIPMMQYSIQADDHDGNRDRFWLTVALGRDGTVAIRMDPMMGMAPIQTGFKYCPGGEHQRVRNALLVLTEAIRLDAEEIDPRSMVHRSDILTEVHKLLDNLPWLEYLGGDTGFSARSNVETPMNLSVYFQEDAFLDLDFTTFRFRSWYGGGRHLQVFSALKILAVAMKLDQEPATATERSTA